MPLVSDIIAGFGLVAVVLLFWALLVTLDIV